MSVAVSVSQLVIAAVFAIAAVAKLVDLTGTRRSIAEFGIPARAVRAVSVALPIVELGIAVGLMWPRSARWAAVAALALVLLFCAAIVRALSRGSAPGCNCFGGLAQTTIGLKTLVRNTALGALAAFAVLGSGTGTGGLGWLDDVVIPPRVATAVIAVLSAALVGLAWFSWQLLRQNGRLLVRLDAQAAELGGGGTVPGAAASGRPALEVGDEAPAFAREDVDGKSVSLESLVRRGQPVVLLFTHSDCAACGPALLEAARAQSARPDHVTVAVVNRGETAGARHQAREFGLLGVIDDADGSLFSAFAVGAVPAAQVIDGGGWVASAQAEGTDAVRELIVGAGGSAVLVAAGEIAVR